MKNKFISEAAMSRKDPRLPEALMCVAYFQDANEEQMSQAMKIDAPYAQKLVELLEECGFVKTKKKKRELTFTQQEILETYQYSFQDLENLFGKQKSKLEQLAELDGLLPDALALAAERGTISIMALMKKFGIGYPRAAKIVDAMEDEGYISPANGISERTVFVKKEDLDDLSKFSGKKTHKREEFFTQDQKTLLKEHENDFNLDGIKFLDEKGKALGENQCKHIKDILIEQFCGIGIVCMEIQDAEVFFKKNGNVLHCKIFEAPSKEELQKFVDENKIDAAMILYEVSPNTSLMEMQPLIPKIELAYFAISTPLPTIKKIKVNVLY